MNHDSESTSIDFCTLGMFIIDDIYPGPSAADQTPNLNVVGGAGTYSAVGARVFSPPPASRAVGWIVDAGSDFPESVRGTITSWDTGVYLRPRDALTTRGWNGYGENDHRGFKYLTEKKRLNAADLTAELLGAKSFHLICSPIRCAEMVAELLDRRRETYGSDFARPTIIWEPVPDLCVAAEHDNTLAALSSVDVISPNHEELGALFSFAHPTTHLSKSAIEEQASGLLNHGIGPAGRGAVVVRAGKEGCYICSHGVKAWLPAYHLSAKSVIDPTGGGNGFLGGFAVGLVRNDWDILEAARWGGVAASLCIEQVGVPTLAGEDGEDRERETWNGINQEKLSDEDKKILEEAHKNKDNPDHPANKDHPKHHDFLKSIPQKLGGAAIFGAGATAGSDAVNAMIGR